MKLFGISEGAVLQRDETGVCRVFIRTECRGTLTCSAGMLSKKGDGFLYTGLSEGGPYSVTFSDGESEITFSKLYVGDVWLLAGQSNMEGAGHATEEDDYFASHTDPSVRAFYMDDAWDDARPLLHQQWKSPDPSVRAVWEGHIANLAARNIHPTDLYPAEQRRGIGPGFRFAKEMYRYTGVPQGVIPCAVGGAPMSMWIPQANENNHLTAALRRIRCAGGYIRGMFWYQGESDTGDSTRGIYADRMKMLLDALSPCCIPADVPVVEVQIGSHSLPFCDDASDNRAWSDFRSMQLLLSERFPCHAVISAIDLERDDLIHLSSDAQKRVGCRAAYAMNRLLTGSGLPEPRVMSVSAQPEKYCPFWYELHITYADTEGALRCPGVPRGFGLYDAGNAGAGSGDSMIQRTLLSGSTVILRTELSLEDLRKKELWYGYGHHSYPNITDELDRAIPACGPISLAELL